MAIKRKPVAQMIPAPVKRAWRIVAFTLLLLFEAIALLYIVTHPPVTKVEVIYERY
ncbi:MAG: hypothetical protein Alpg2KO_24720 [Alphaproteobacteria bacterium]